MIFNKAKKFQPLEKGLFCLAVLLHISLALSIHLSPDEAHYALYATHLDWSYYDHPPLVGWLQWMMLQSSQIDFICRIAPQISWILSVYLSIALYQQFQDTRSRPLDQENEHLQYRSYRVGSALILWLTSPLLTLLGFALVPDCLLLPLVSAMMLLTWTMTHQKGAPSTHQWVLLGVLLGLCGLSKYTAILLAMSAGFVLLKTHGFKLLKEKGCWIACIIALLMITPILYWNMKHEWSSFVYQFGHASGSQPWQLRKSISYAIVLLLAFGPLLAIGLIFSNPKREPNTDMLSKNETSTLGGSDSSPSAMTVAMFSWAYGLPTVLLFILLAGRGSALPHWIAPAWVALIPLAAIGLDRWRAFMPRLWRGILSFQALCCAGLVVLIFSGGIGNEVEWAARSLPGEKPPSSKPNPFADLIGWDMASKRAMELASENHANSLAVMNWTLASRVAWYARPLPVKVIQSHHDQFDLWFGPMQEGDDVIWIDWSLMTFDKPLATDQFESCDLLEQMPIIHWGRQIAHFNFLYCKNWQSTTSSK